MTAYRFRVKFEPDPTSLWRDIVVGADRTLAEFQSAINSAVGLDQDHLWFIGEGENYWNSTVTYQCPQEYEESPGGESVLSPDQIENAGEVTIGEMTRQLGLEQYDRICYLYDYGDEWRFYAILKAVNNEEPDYREPSVVNEKGDLIDDQYEPRGPDEADPPLPDPLDAALPETAVPVADLRELEAREDIVHVVPLHSLETGYGAVCDRFAVQFADTGYVLENFQPRWQVVKRVDGTGESEEELLATVADAVRDWHAEIAEIAGTMSGQRFDDETIEAMDVELEAELERKGYSHL